jgi:two-component system response regulator FixJ
MQPKSDHFQALGNVLVIDDDASVRRSLSTMLDRAGYEVSLFESADEFLKKPILSTPAVVVLDMRMPGTTGVALQSQLRTLSQSAAVVFVSGDSRPDEIIAAMKQGAVDFLLKPFSAQAMLDAVQKAMLVAEQLAMQSKKQLKVSERLARLTPRELEICHWMVRGYSNQQIASIDGGAAATVKLHRARVMEKMSAQSLPELIDMLTGMELPAPMAASLKAAVAQPVQG